MGFAILASTTRHIAGILHCETVCLFIYMDWCWCCYLLCVCLLVPTMSYSSVWLATRTLFKRDDDDIDSITTATSWDDVVATNWCSLTLPLCTVPLHVMQRQYVGGRCCVFSKKESGRTTSPRWAHTVQVLYCMFCTGTEGTAIWLDSRDPEPGTAAGIKITGFLFL